MYAGCVCVCTSVCFCERERERERENSDLFRDDIFFLKGIANRCWENVHIGEILSEMLYEKQMLKQSIFTILSGLLFKLSP